MALPSVRIACLNSSMWMISFKCSPTLMTASPSTRVRRFVPVVVVPMLEDKIIFRETLVEAGPCSSVQLWLVAQLPRPTVAMS